MSMLACMSIILVLLCDNTKRAVAKSISPITSVASIKGPTRANATLQVHRKLCDITILLKNGSSLSRDLRILPGNEHSRDIEIQTLWQETLTGTYVSTWNETYWAQRIEGIDEEIESDYSHLPMLRRLMSADRRYSRRSVRLLGRNARDADGGRNYKDDENYEDDEDVDDDEEGWADDAPGLTKNSEEEGDYFDEPFKSYEYSRRCGQGKHCRRSYAAPRRFDSALDKREEKAPTSADGEENCQDDVLGVTDAPLQYVDYDKDDLNGDESLGQSESGVIISPSLVCQLCLLLSIAFFC